MHPAVRNQRASLANADNVSVVEDLAIYLRFFIMVYFVGYLIAGGLFIAIGLIVAFFTGAYSLIVWVIVKFWFTTMIVGLPFGLIVWLGLRIPLRFLGVPEIGSALFTSIPSLMVGLHLGMTLAGAKSLEWSHLARLVSQDVSGIWWIYLIGVILAPFFAMKAMNE